MSNHGKQLLVAAGLAVIIAAGGSPIVTHAAELALANSPILSGGADPNVLLTLDESGSMARASMPDERYNPLLSPPANEDLSDVGDHARFCSAYYNTQYYNPAVHYNLPVTATGVTISTSFTTARDSKQNPYENATPTRNLSTNYNVVVQDSPGSRNPGTCGQSTIASGFYFKFNSGKTYTAPGPTTVSCTAADRMFDDQCYDKVVIGKTSGADADPGVTFDVDGNGTIDLEDSKLNFAIWYSFYRTRILAAKTIVSRVYAGLPSNIRVAGQALTNTDSTKGWTTTIGPMARFDPTTRGSFYQRLFRIETGSSTPLRSAMSRAGEYYKSSGASSPYRITPSDPGNSGPELACRQNFHLLVTDGYWNTNNESSVTNAGDKDSTVDATGFKDVAGNSVLKWAGGGSGYDARTPYSDRSEFDSNDAGTNVGPSSNTLADIAMYYWMTDLRSDLTNVDSSGKLNAVPKYIVAKVNGTEDEKFWHPANDPAYWQHMVNFTVAMGLSGTLNPKNYNSELQLKSDTTQWIRWPEVYPTAANDSSNNAEKLDDLWHAAVNSRGRFYSTQDPQSLELALSNVFENVTARSGAASAASVNSGTLNANTRLYQSYYSDGWTGHLKSFKVDQATGLITFEWDAADAGNISPAASRVVLTFDPTQVDPAARGIPFQWSNLNSTQKNYLADDPATAAVETTATSPTTTPALVGTAGGQNRLDYLRGDTTYEDVLFRVRAGKLGDLVNSSPALASNENFGYKNDLEGASNLYSTYVASKSSRTPVVYVGGNDGMLHGFDAGYDKTTNDKTTTAGNEVLAYVSNLVFPNLGRLTDPAYGHRYYVDGTPTVADAFVPLGARCPSGPSCWRTILVGGLNHGGKGYYALDVSDPSAYSEANAGKIALWEFSDPKLGYSYSQAAIVRMANGDWAAVFGNGYNNTDGQAYLFIVKLSDGTLLVPPIPTKAGSLATPNGLATPMPVDVDGDGKVDYIYAGDLLGNLWKFNVRSANKNSWDVAFKSGANPVPLFTAGSGKPITSRPDVGLHPSGNGYLVYFGTGKLLEGSDRNSTGTQTFYGIWDQDTGTSSGKPQSGPPVLSANLLEQTIVDRTDVITGNRYRITSDNAIVWWNGSTGYQGWYMNLTDSGERVIAAPVFRGNRVIFVTMAPGGDSCEGSGTGWLMVLDAYDGGRVAGSAFDVDQNGVFGDAGDQVDGAAGAMTAVYASGVQTAAGTASTAVTVIAGGGKEYAVGQSIAGTPFSVGLNPGSVKGKRISWRQLK